MLVDRQFIFVAVVLIEIVTKPMWKDLVDPFYRFTKSSTTQCSTTTTAVVRNDDLESLVFGSCP